MKPKFIDCYKFTLTNERHRVSQLLYTVLVSTFWVLTASKASFAQINPNEQNKSDFRLGLGTLLPVPTSPLPNGQKSPAQTVPPPPDASTASVIAPLVNPVFKAKQQTPADEMKQMENAFIHKQLTRDASSSISSSNQLVPHQKQTNLSRVAGKNKAKASDLGLGRLDVAGGTNIAQQRESNLEQEFTAPGESTFNQLLKSQPEVAPLPPLPGSPTRQESSTPVATLTFNQLLNQGGTGWTNTPTAQLTQTDTPYPYTQPVNSPRPLIDNPAVPNTQRPSLQPRPLITNPALREPNLHFQGVYITQGSDSTARARLQGVYPLTPQVLVGGTLDVNSDNSSLVDSRGQGLNINELYLATSLAGLPNLRFVVGQLDLTSYFDRNSFAKDGASQFFNPVFQTNPALAATGIASRTGLLVNWSATDNIEAKAAIFSSANKISDFALDGFAGEIGIRYGNAIIRGTYASDRDAGVRDSFPESFGIARNSAGTVFGPLKNDREESYGLNTEVYIPNLKLGLFGRYGRYEDRDLGKGANTYSFGATLLDLFTANDRVGLAYGRSLSNDSLRGSGKQPDVLELYYDFQVLPFLRLGFTLQGRDEFNETIVGVRVKTELDVTPKGKGR